MPPGIFLVALLSTLGIVAFTVIRVARLFATRPQLLGDEVAERLEELEQTVHGLQRELSETQERIDFAERLLGSGREEKRLGG